MVLIWASSSSLAAILQVVLELEGRVEVVLDGALVAARDEDDLVEPRGDRLLHDVLDGGLVDERQHLLRLGLGRGQEARAEPRGGEDGLANAAHAGPGLSPVIRTWILSFLTRYQRLRSVMPRILAARACTPPAFCERVQDHAPLPLLEHVVERAGHGGRTPRPPPRPWRRAGRPAGRCSGRMTPSESTMARLEHVLAARGYCPATGRSRGSGAPRWTRSRAVRHSRCAARSRRCVDEQRQVVDALAQRRQSRDVTPCSR